MRGRFTSARPTLHFLTGKSLSRLHDGAAVPFDFQLIIAAGSKNNVVARSLERFTVSYDVWEEKFSVVRVRDFRRSGMRLSASSAEAWCLDNIVDPNVRAAARPATLGAPGNPQRRIQRATGRQQRHQSRYLDRDFQPAVAPAAGSLVGGIGAVPVGRSEAIAMNRLRNRLILVFVVATLAPLCLMGWISLHLLRYSLSLSSTPQLDQVSHVAQTGRA